MQANRKPFLRATAGFLAGSLLGCAPAGLVVGPLGLDRPASGTAPELAKPAAATAGSLSFTFRWPGLPGRQTQALPGSARFVVVLVWQDAERKTAAAVRVFRRDNPDDTYFNGQTGRLESSGRLFLPAGEGYVLDLKAYASDPGYREIDAPTPADQLTCGAAATPTPDATTSPEATSSPDATASPDATPTPAPTEAPCLSNATALAYGATSPFKIAPGYVTTVRVNLTVPNGPQVTSISPAVLGSQGGEVVISGSGFGTDPAKVRVALVPPYLGPQPFEIKPSEVTDTSIKARLPEGSSGGTLFAFIDGVEASSAAPQTVQVVRKLFITSSNLKFDMDPSQQKVYAVANASVSLGVYGEPINGGACCWDPNRPSLAPQGSVQLSPSILTVTPTGNTTATASVNASGVVIFPDKGTWKIGNLAGIEQSLPGDVNVGVFQSGSGNQVIFTRGVWDTNSQVSVLVPQAAEQWFQWGQGVLNQAAPQPNAALYHPGGKLSLRSDDFTWTTTPGDVLNVSNDGNYTTTSSRREDIKFTGVFKLDPGRKIEGTLKTGFTMAVSPDDVSLSQPVTGGTLDLTKQQLYFTLTAPNGASASNIPPCRDCTPSIPSNQYEWASSDESLAKVTSAGLVSVVTTTATGDVSVSVNLTADPERKATASVHVTNNGGLVLDLQ